MDIISSHNGLDFDGLASMVAAGILYPSAEKVFSGTLSRNVKKFMALYKDSLKIKNAREIDLQKVEKVILVDIANPSRLGNLKQLAQNTNIEFIIYDHHPPSVHDLHATIKEVHEIGATTTILVEEIIKRNIKISRFDASILALGIYEDTGSLLFTSTTHRDASAVAFLLKNGANLSVVANFIEQPFSGEQRILLQDLFNSSRRYKINNLDIVIAVLEHNIFIPGLDIVTHRLFEVEQSDVLFVVALMDNKLYIVARSKTSHVKVNQILKPFGGGGHEKAASAVVKDKNIEESIKTLMESLKKSAHPAIVAADIMSTPVKTIPAHISMEEAGRIMLRYGYTGLPVIEGEKIIGLISRRDLDKARIHQLGHAPVKGFMSSDVHYVKPSTPVSEIQNIMVEYDIGRLPVIEDIKLVGIVSRTDILRILHGDEYTEDHTLLYQHNEDNQNNFSNLMQERLPLRILEIMKKAGEIADSRGDTVYCVGGFVRDLFLQVPNYDLDLVVEGDGLEISKLLAYELDGKARLHERFKTGVVILPDKSKIDVATARTEYYEFPAALPTVEKSSIKEDLYRRDFTINTLAICLNSSKFGLLIDYFGGRKDLQKGLVRILYNFSFVEDPTRIIRAVRFEQRYNFSFEENTLRFAKDAIDRKLLGKLSYSRILHELILILNEREPIPAINRMQEIGVWDFIIPEVKLEEIDWDKFRKISLAKIWWDERFTERKIRIWLVRIILILKGLNEEGVYEVLKRYPFDRNAEKNIKQSLLIDSYLERLKGESQLSASRIDSFLKDLSNEVIMTLLICIKEEVIFEKLIHYLEIKEKVSLEINGNDLKEMGVKEGPQFKILLNDLYNLKLDEKIKNKEEELGLVQQWLNEGRFD